MSELSDFLDRQIKSQGWSLRDAERKLGISHSAIDSLLKNARKPELETLTKIAQGFNLPLWRVMEMAGFDLGFSGTSAALAQRLSSLLDRMPEFRSVAERLLQLRPDDLQGFVIYLEGLQAYRDRQNQG